MIDVLLGNIIAAYMDLPTNRVVIYNGRFDAPTDQGIYVIIAFQNEKVVGVSSRFDDATEQETLRITTYSTFNIDMVSRGDEAFYRKSEVIMALASQASERVQEDNSIRIFRTDTINDLSAVEGSASLHRYQIPVIISSVEEKNTSVSIIDKFRSLGVNTNG